jgi:hypothetical protein
LHVVVEELHLHAGGPEQLAVYLHHGIEHGGADIDHIGSGFFLDGSKQNGDAGEAAITAHFGVMESDFGDILEADLGITALGDDELAELIG